MNYHNSERQITLEKEMTEVLLFLLLMPASDWKESFAVLLIQNTNGFQPLPSHTLHDETSTTIETEWMVQTFKLALLPHNAIKKPVMVVVVIIRIIVAIVNFFLWLFQARAKTSAQEILTTVKLQKTCIQNSRLMPKNQNIILQKIMFRIIW